MPSPGADHLSPARVASWPLSRHEDCKSQCKPPALLFQDVGTREVSAVFDGGQVTSDQGGLLLREVEPRFGFIASFARCFTDYRDPELIEHILEQLSLTSQKTAPAPGRRAVRTSSRRRSSLCTA